MKIFQFLFTGCALILFACTTASPVPTLEISLPTSTVTPTPLPTETASPTLPPADPSLPYGFTADQVFPILYTSYPNFILLGAFSDSRWLNASEAAGVFQQERTYDFYMSDVKLGSGIAFVEGDAMAGPPGSCDYHNVKLSSFVIAGMPPTFGFAAGQPVEIRPVEELSKENPLYGQFVAEWLSLQEVPNPIVNINRILRVDIEGDGVAEVLINASNFKEQTGHLVETGDYSIVLMRKVVGDTVYTVPLAADVYHGKTPVLRFPPTYFLENIFDLNGDGKLEVIVSGKWWEGGGVYVYEIYGIGASKVLSVDCGLVTQN